MKALIVLILALLIAVAIHLNLTAGNKNVEIQAAKHSPEAKQQRKFHKYDLYQRFIIVPEHQLLFCFIEKVGCKMFSGLFKDLRSRYDPSLKYGSVWNRNSYRQHGLTLEQLKSYIPDPSWHKAVFYREPLERFLSGYRSKCEPHHDTDTFHCNETFGSHRASFPEAVYRLKQKDSIFDPHWIPQSQFCGGLRENLQYFRTVEMLDTETVGEKVGTLLSDVGVDPNSVPAYSLLSTNLKLDSEPKKMHETHAAENIEMYYSKPEFVCIVMNYYLSDYDLFNIPVPEWVHKFDYHTSPQLEEECKDLIEKGLL